mmetsp:Transcript_27948/g.60636  ORF Transcript_27948/g.60636 Transcript_27948/m.60636 type:complete len:222 (-) Transcript_27948:20-685(-)
MLRLGFMALLRRILLLVLLSQLELSLAVKGSTKAKSRRDTTALEMRIGTPEACAACRFVAGTFKDKVARAVGKAKKVATRQARFDEVVPTLCDEDSWPAELGYYDVDGKLAVRNYDIEGDGSGQQVPVKDEDGEVQFEENGRPMMRWVEVNKVRAGPEVRADAKEACMTFVAAKTDALRKEVVRLHIRDTDWTRVICENLHEVCPPFSGEDTAPDFGRVEL